MRKFGLTLLQESPLGRIPREWKMKNPAKSRAHTGGVLSREVGPTTAARKGSLALGIEADYSGGTAADLHGLPHFPGLLESLRVYGPR